MKKILFIVMCFLLVGVVNAKTLTKEEIAEEFINTTFITILNQNADESKKISIVNNQDNETFDIKVGEEVVRTYSYAEGYVHFVDDRELTKPIVEDQVNDMIYLMSLMEAALKKSGVDVDKLKAFEDNVLNNFEQYDVYVNKEDYNFEDEGVTYSGEFIREFKLGFDTDKLTAFANAVGFEDQSTPEPTGKIPVVKLLSKDKTTVSLSIYVEGNEDYKCNLYRSTSKTSGFEKVFNEPFSCTDKTAIYLDEGLNENTTYYYRASVDGETTFSNILEVALGNTSTNTNTNTNSDSNVTNPKTGVNQFIPLIIGFFASIIVLFIFHKNSGIKL